MWWKKRKKSYYPKVSSDSFKKNMQQECFWITSTIALGPFVDEEKAKILKQEQINAILNVGTIPPKEVIKPYFKTVIWEPIIDLKRIPDSLTLTCLEHFHQLVSLKENKVYIHCIAGQNRSPTILWLYFIGCGLPEEAATELITRSSMDAIPGHPKLVDIELIEMVKKYGKTHFQPVAYPEILTPSL